MTLAWVDSCSVVTSFVAAVIGSTSAVFWCTMRTRIWGGWEVLCFVSYSRPQSLPLFGVQIPGAETDWHAISQRAIGMIVLDLLSWFSHLLLLPANYSY
ncbi:uncharacterized protein K460DRAFT_371406 [Cucurbitaria berberidis CBS 394.84]|uniref:Uncharacterized protein n=1 Tax=Cucurbitaria berberidis CBS 394.84 TaxID=1168544 RepID=A0A9P4G703_9PLEO|nr:uncharacterized protein K460DRAFT_371406 [Cucurbitaria berberidis CBS 394.84]KAF1840195.1 hypothetical protein K460DRAFT_371406 [Cucurbitaria berberidis CBS 394.84]